MATFRAIAAVLAGILVSMVLVGVIESTGHLLFPVEAPPQSSPEAIAEWAATLPLGALLSVLVAWAVGLLCGIVVAQWLWPAGRRAAARWVGGLMLLAVIANLVMIPPPVWFATVGLLSVVAISFWMSRAPDASTAKSSP